MKNQLVKDQFNRQATQYANWQVPQETKGMNDYFDFCRIKPDDRLLDVACGTGGFVTHVAGRVLTGRGVDISDHEIDMARQTARERGLANVAFDCADVEHLPYLPGAFSVVVCRYAFHHFTHPGAVLGEMLRCCTAGGKVSILDVAAYREEHVNRFFETFDKLVDVSHNRTLDEKAFDALYAENGVEKLREIVMEVELNVQEYISHAFQEPENEVRLGDLLRDGRNDEKLRNYLFEKDGQLHFKRRVYYMLGRKAP